MDRQFAVLLALEWVAPVATAVWLSPLTWTGTTSRVHPHVWAAILLGAVVTLSPSSPVTATGVSW